MTQHPMPIEAVLVLRSPEEVWFARFALAFAFLHATLPTDGSDRAQVRHTYLERVALGALLAQIDDMTVDAAHAVCRRLNRLAREYDALDHPKGGRT